MSNALTMQNVMHKVYAWMCVGLLVTAGASYGLLMWPQLFQMLFSSRWYFFLLAGLQIGLVIYVSAYINQMRYSTAAAIFMLYSFLLGITLAPIFVIYTASSIALTFACTAGMFGTMAIYGYFTNTDLSKFGNILLMALWGMILASLANWYFKSSTFEYVLALIGIVIFTGLTAYDVQKIKELLRTVAYQGDADAYHETVNKVALIGTLTLYLDFVNLFLQLLQFTGRKRD